MTAYRTVSGDTVDLIAWRYYGSESFTLAILEANPGLAALGPLLPAGTLVLLPRPADIRPAEARGVQLWD